jgi:hypothetical protein
VIQDKHFQELLASGIDPDIIRLNFKSLSGTAPYDYLLYSDKLERLNAGRLSSKWIRTYRHLDNGGWYSNGLDPFNNWEPMEWGVFKPDTPRRSSDEKLIKYEHPPKENTRAFFPRVTPEIWQKVAFAHGIVMPAIFEITPEGEAKGFWQWVQDHIEIPIFPTEGAKKAVALLTNGYVAIGLPGITGGYRTPKDEHGNRKLKARYLIPELEPFTKGGREFNICFDQDIKQKTIRAVRQAIAIFGQIIVNTGSNVKVLSWDGRFGKGVDDFIINQGAKAFYQVYKQAKPLFQWQRRQELELTYPVDLTISRRYIGSLPIPESAKLICLKAPKGTGKTETIAQIVQEAITIGQPVLVITHRVQLGEALCDRFGLPYVTQLGECEVGKLFGYGVCVDSLHPSSQARFDADGWEDALVIIDEAEQVIWHMLSASTEVKQNRVSVLRQFKQLISNVITTDGRVVLSDADLSDISVDYIRQLSGIDVQPWVCINEWKPEKGWTIYNYNDINPAGIVLALEAHIADGGKPLVLCSGQRIKSKWGTQLLEKRLQQQFPELKILRVDAESTSDPSHPAYGCTTVADEVFKNYDIVLGSPTIETGLSLDLQGHFTSVWGIAQGTLAENSVRQQLARLREGVDRHLWAAPYGGNLIGNGSTYDSGLLTSQDLLCKIHIRELQKADSDFEDLDANFDRASLKAFARLGARVNAGKVKYRDSILDGLVEEGHTIVHVGTDPDGGKEMNEQMKDLRDVCHLEEAEAEVAIEMPTVSEFEELSKKKAKTKEERLKERKYSRHLKYGIDITTELILLDDDGWYPQLQLHYYCSIGREYLNNRDRKRADAQRKAGEGAVWKLDFNRSQLSGKVILIEGLGILKLLDPEREYRKTDTDLEQLADLAKINARNIRSALGVSIHESDTPIVVLQKLLKKVGIKLHLLRREGSEGNRVRVYGYTPPAGLRDEIFGVWLHRDTSTTCNSDQIMLNVDAA